MKISTNQLLFIVVVIVALLTVIFRKKKGVITSVEKYRAKVDTFAYFVARNEQFEYGWNPDFSKSAKMFKSGEIVGDAIGIFPTVNQLGKEFTFIVFEISFVYNTKIYLCIDKSNLELIQ